MSKELDIKHLHLQLTCILLSQFGYVGQFMSEAPNTVKIQTQIRPPPSLYKINKMYIHVHVHLQWCSIPLHNNAYSSCMLLVVDKSKHFLNYTCTYISIELSKSATGIPDYRTYTWQYYIRDRITYSRCMICTLIQ